MDYENPSSAPTFGPEDAKSGMTRGEPDVAEARRELVSSILKEVQLDKEHFKKTFARMRKDQEFVRKQLPAETENDDRAKVNIIQRHVQTRVAALYAKNPTFVAERRHTLDFAVWDGKKASLDQAMQKVQQAGAVGLPPDPDTAALLSDIQNAISRRQMLDRVGKTMQVALEYSIGEQQPPFKPQCKQAVRRAIVTGVGYLKLAFQRQLARRPDDEARLADVTVQLANLERLQADLQDGEFEENSREAERLRLVQQEIQGRQDQVVREGLVIDFPRPTHIIPDRNTTQLTVGFPGARRVTEVFWMTKAEIEEVYNVDVGTSYTSYKMDCRTKDYTSRNASGDDCKACVYEVYDRKDGLRYIICDGYPNFLLEPTAPDLDYIEPFFPFFPLTFNPIEDEEDVYPDSDVRLLMPTQKEVNRKREALRQHRIANRPLNVARKGVLTEEDAKSLANHEAHDVIELEGLEQGDDVAKVFAPFPKPGVDPNLYETSTDLTDVSLIVGAAPAQLGAPKSDSATDSSIAENSRAQDVASNIDDVDDWLSAFARAAGQVLLHEMSADTIKQVAGPGAVWPQLSAQDIAEEVFLTIQAGSSGRPNKSQDLANLERATPILVQTPGVNPEWLAKKVLNVLDPHIDLEDAYIAGLPSITAMNRAAQPGTGDPASDPNAQGGAGGQNAPNDDTSKGGAQPAYPGAPGGPSGGAPPML